MFAEFEQGAEKTEDCKVDCKQKYTLQIRTKFYLQWTVYSIEGDVIVT